MLHRRPFPILGAGVLSLLVLLAGVLGAGVAHSAPAMPEGPALLPTATAYPTSTPYPTETAYPTSSPWPSATYPAATATLSPTPAGPPPGTPGIIAGGPGDQAAPRTDGNYVVFEDNSAGTWAILARDLSAPNAVFPIYRGAADARHPAISGNLVVWQDYRNGDWDIYGAYLTGDQAGPSFAIFTGPGDQVNPAVSGSVVVWQSTLITRADIVAEDLSNRQPFIVSNNTTTNLNPAIDGPNVVWQSQVPTMTLGSRVGTPAGVGQWDILGYDLQAGHAFTVSQSIGDKTNPAINGQVVAWQVYSTTQALWHIAGADLSTSTEFTVTTDLTSNQMLPAIVGDTIAYQDDGDQTGDAPFRHGRWGILALNRITRVRQRVSDALTDATRAAISTHRVVWNQATFAGDLDVYGTVCSTSYADVHPSDYFYGPVGWFACSGMLSGYACGGAGEPCDPANDSYFRPYTNITRGQLAKLIVLARSWPIDTTGGPHFTDVPPTSPFYGFVETAYNHGAISGYSDGTFRPGADVTRGQLTKIIVTAQGWSIDTIGGPHFTDVPPAAPFYGFVETAYNHGVISGYADGTFRPGSTATRGQITKIVYGALNQP